MNDLNIHNNIKRLIEIAISKYKVKKDQAKALGVSEYKYNSYLKQFNLQYLSYWDYR